MMTKTVLMGVSMNSLRVFLIHPGKSIVALDTLPTEVPDSGFVWLAMERNNFGQNIEQVQAWLAQQTSMPLLDLHVSDLLNAQLRSHFDYTSVYDMLVIRRLADGDAPAQVAEAVAPAGKKAAKNAAVMPAARKVQTAPVGFVVFDRVLLSVHPDHCSTLAAYVKRLNQLADAAPGRSMPATVGGTVGTARLPDTPAELDRKSTRLNSSH